MGLWSSKASTESSYNGVMGIGLDSPETGGDGSSAGSVDVGIGKRRMCSHRSGVRGRILAGDGFSRMGGYYFPMMDLRTTGPWERVL